MGAADDAAIDTDLVRADAVLEASPVQDQADHQEQQQRDAGDQRGLKPARRCKIADAGIAPGYPAQAPAKSGQEDERMQPFRDCEVGTSA